MTKSRWLPKLLPLAVSFATAIAAAGAFAPPTWAQSNPPPQAQEVQLAQAAGFSIPIWIYPLGAMFLVFIFIPKIGWTLGLIAIGEREVGIVTKKFSRKNLPSSRLIALDGEGGLQADTPPRAPASPPRGRPIRRLVVSVRGLAAPVGLFLWAPRGAPACPGLAPEAGS